MSLTKLGRYEIVKPLGKGAMGLVYEAQDPNLDRRVAIKTIRVDQLSQELATEYESRFRAEARAGGRLQHPNIIGVYDSGRDEGMAYMVMELVRGGDLKQQLDQGARLSFDRSFALMRELLSALSFAHELGIIHRDIKPANVMLDSNGRVKLGDFGVARITHSGEATRTQGSMVGTLKYMSPEQVQGLQVDSRTDLFAAGVVLYQLLTGVKPFDGANDFAIMQAIAQQEPAPPSSLNAILPASIDEVVARALAKDRNLRYATARDFMLGLRAVAAQAGGRAATMLPTAAAPLGPGRAAPAAPGEASSAAIAGPGALPRATTAAPGEVSLAASHGGTNTHLPPVSADPSATSPSALSQEMELLYWKDIQDSSDPVDFQGFLQQFPAGVYAGLAARRLRRLARTLADSTGSQSVLGTSPFGGETSARIVVEAAPTLAEEEPVDVASAEVSSAEVASVEIPLKEPASVAETAPNDTARAEPTPADDDAQRLATARAAEEEALWQEALRRDARRQREVRHTDAAERAGSEGTTGATADDLDTDRNARQASRDADDQLAAQAQRAAELRWLGDSDTRGDAVSDTHSAARADAPESSSFIDISTAPTAGLGATQARNTSARAFAAIGAIAGVVLLAALAWWAFGRGPSSTAGGATAPPATAAPTAATPPPASALASTAPPAAAQASAAAARAAQIAATEATTARAIAMPTPFLSLADAVVQIESDADPSISVAARTASSTLIVGRDTLRLSVTSNTAGYVYLLGAAADDDRLELLLPTRVDGRSPIKADATTVFRLDRKNNLTIPGPWHLLVLVSKQARDLSAAGWHPREAGVSRHFGPNETAQNRPWPEPSCTPGVDPCSDSYGTQEVELIVLPAPAADDSARTSTAPAPAPPLPAELPKSR